jgi:hypothetical protein
MTKSNKKSILYELDIKTLNHIITYFERNRDREDSIINLGELSEDLSDDYKNGFCFGMQEGYNTRIEGILIYLGTLKRGCEILQGK